MTSIPSFDYRTIIESFKAKKLTEKDIEQRLSDLMLVFDFSASLNRSSSLAETANLLLLTLMGYTAARRSVFFLCGRSGLQVVASKGYKARLQTSEIQCEITPPFLDYYLLNDNSEGHLGALRELFQLRIIVPLHKEGTLLGLIGLGDKIGQRNYSDHELQMIASVVQMCASTVKNAEIHQMLESLNRQLILRVYQLNTLFELSKDFNAVWDAETIFRILGNTLIGQLLISRCAVVVLQSDGPAIKYMRGFRLHREDVDFLNRQHQLGLLPEKNPVLGAESTNKTLEEYYSAHKIHLIVPMVLNDELHGWIFLGDRKMKKEFTQADFDFISTLTSLALVSNVNAQMQQQMIEKQRMEKELSIAREIQFSLLPQSIPDIPTYGIATAFQPAYQVGGDYFDFLRVSETELAVAIGDVSGKSTPAAMIMASLQASLRTLASIQVNDPQVTLQRINQLLCRSHGKSNKYVTFFYGVLNHTNHQFIYVNAGHCYPLILKKNGSVDRLETGGMVMGFFEDIVYRSGHYEFEPEDLMILYTDGVSELINSSDEEFGTDRIVEELQQHRSDSVSEIRDSLVRTLREYRGDQNQFDDLTFILMKRITI